VPQPLRIAYTLEQCWHDVPGGSAVAALEVLRRLVQCDDVEMVAVAGRHRAPPVEPYVPPVPVRQLAIARPWLYEAWNRIGRPHVERATGPVDVCHSTIAIPAPTRAPHVVTVHDVAFVHTPERFSAHGARVMRAGLEHCRAADLVLVPSRATADDLAELGFESGQVRVVPWGVEAHAVTDGDLARVRTRHALPERFVLFVGTLEPRKNLARLATAVAQVDESVPLLVAGATGWGDAAPSGDHVRFLGFVDALDLPALYASATVFAYPSLQEGFGMPILEAMAHGAPVVTSRGSSTEEAAGGAAALADPTDVDSIAAAISSVLADPTPWVAKGRARAATASWDATVDATVAAYREVAR
jgi:glycosyltransferase involved in cell wall biosynthesis